MRANRLLIALVLLTLSIAAVPGEASTGGYLAMYNVRYSNEAFAGDLKGITISFDFDQWIWEHDPETQLDTPHVFEDLIVNVTFPSQHAEGNIFMTNQEAAVILVDHKISLGDVPVGIHHFDLEADLPAAPWYCVELDLPNEYREFLSTETTFCTVAD